MKNQELSTALKKGDPLRASWLDAIRRVAGNIKSDGSIIVDYNDDGVTIKLPAKNAAPSMSGGSEFDPTTISGWDATKQQILTHSSGTLAWVTLTAEESTTAFECPT